MIRLKIEKRPRLLLDSFSSAAIFTLFCLLFFFFFFFKLVKAQDVQYPVEGERDWRVEGKVDCLDS